MCQFCRNDNEILQIKITDKYGTTCYCPNCLAIHTYNNIINFVPNTDFIDDITKEPGAIRYEAYDESYTLNLETFKRLIRHNLTPEEYFTLCILYGENKYMIHDDFYTEEGIAIQPM